jgi:uncharacterized protein (UPF0333 family)
MGVMCYNKGAGVFRRGQAALEYVLALAGLLIVTAIMWGLVGASEKQSVRTVRLVTAEYP